ncbi:hypothetical protein PBRA_001989 [Plasmodiophora brassicae]|uniref:SKP1 component POZ domain-containing protein n=1 Tax=Plasmodiophora brassicae TaxID=37360 RepID=A0A0G4J180_PLABS|nr:hypothetical protein PBRA_001989 [Plasmodiophora brassicae]
MPVLVVLRSLFVTVVVGCAGDAVRLRSGDGVDHVVDTQDIVAHSPVVKNLLAELGASVEFVPLPNVNSTELQAVIPFVTRFEVHDIELAVEWTETRVRSMDFQSVCRLLSAADYLDMRLLSIAVASRRRSWIDIPAMHDLLPRHAFRFAMGVARLTQVAQNEYRKAIAQMCRTSLVLGIDATPVNDAGWTFDGSVLHWAARKDEEFLVELLLYLPGIDVNALDFLEKTPLHWAATYGHVGVVRLLVDAHGIAVNARDDNGWTPLHAAAADGHADVVSVLMHVAGIEADATLGDGTRTPLTMAVEGQHVEVVHVLVSGDTAGVDVNAVVGVDESGIRMTALHYASGSGFDDIVRILLSANGTDVNARDGERTTSLHWAATLGHANVARLLIDAGADVNAPDQDGNTGLHRAASTGYANVVELFLQVAVVAVNARNNDGKTALHLAAAAGHDDVLELLADDSRTAINARDRQGNTALHLAASAGHDDAVKALLRASATEVTARTMCSWTALHCAALHGHVDVAALLLDAQGDIDADDKATALDLAWQGGHVNIVMMLHAAAEARPHKRQH